MLRSFAKLRAVDLGFEPSRVLTFSVEPPPSGYTGDQARLLQERILRRIESLPGVEAVGADRCPPLQSCMVSVVSQAGTRRWDFEAGSRGPEIGVHSATPQYFRTLGVPVKRGRVFDGTERPGTPRVIVINEAAAEKLFPGQDPIGQRITVLTAYFAGGEEPAEVIGVVGNVRYAAPDQAGDNLQVYAPAFQWSTRATTFMVKTRGEPDALIPAVRDAVIREAADLPIYNVRSMAERAADATARSRFATLLLGIFAAASLALAAVGIYGVMSFAVAQRTRELGVRMALGARGRSLLGLVLRQGAALLLVGGAIGLAGSFATTRALRGLLFEVTPNDPLTMAAGVAVLSLVAMAAVLVPAWRAMRHDPMHALRT
jgi:putative ABC transport system permease protein